MNVKLAEAVCLSPSIACQALDLGLWHERAITVCGRTLWTYVIAAAGNQRAMRV